MSLRGRGRRRFRKRGTALVRERQRLLQRRWARS